MEESVPTDLDHVISQRQPEMADETRNSYIAETISERIDISMENLRFTTVSEKVSRRD